MPASIEDPDLYAFVRLVPAGIYDYNRRTTPEKF
jgi:hypothetical protein